MLINLNTKAVLFFLFAWFNFSLMEVTAKYLTLSYPVLEVVWMRFIAQAFVLSILFFPSLKKKVKTKVLHLHLLRSICLFLAATFFFAGFSQIGLADATAIYNLSPLLLTLGGIFFLKEKLTKSKIISVLLGITGALIIINPTSNSFSLFAILPCLAALCLAAFGLITRYFGENEDPFTSLIYSALIGTLLSSMTLIWFWIPLDIYDLPFILILGIVSTLGHFLLIRAFQLEEASNLATFSSVAIIFNTIWGVLIFSEIPTTKFFVGTFLIVVGCLLILKRNKNSEI